MSVDKSEFDSLKNATGVIGTRDAAGLAGLGGYLPGVFGKVAEVGSETLNLAAEGDDLETAVALLSRRNGDSILEFSSLLRNEKQGYDGGYKHTIRYSGLASRLGMAAVGGVIGGTVGSFIIPVVGTFIGGAIGTVAGGYSGGVVSSFVFPEDGPTNSQLALDMIEKQQQLAVEEADVLRVIARKLPLAQQQVIEQEVAGGNTSGRNLSSVRHALLPVLGEDFFAGHETPCQYVARMCNEGKLDVAQLFKDEAYMEFRPLKVTAVEMTAYNNAELALPSVPSKPRSNGRA